jgi:uncharacterized protein (TIGR02246 family)
MGSTMSRLRTLFAVALVATLAACANVQPDAKVQSIQDATNAWRDAFDRHDATALAGLYANDAVLWGTLATTPITTNAGLVDYFTRAGSVPQLHVIINATYVRVMDDFATNSGTYTFVFSQDGQIVTQPARFTFTYRRVDGRWLIVAQHSSLLPK